MAIFKVAFLITAAIMMVPIRPNAGFHIIYGGTILSGIHRKLSGGCGEDLNFPKHNVLDIFGHKIPKAALHGGTRRTASEDSYIPQSIFKLLKFL